MLCSPTMRGSASAAMQVRQRSFWIDSLPESQAIHPLRGSSRCDIAIIGGGFTGLSTAYHVRKLLPGADVCVIEADVCGFGSSGRCGGFSSTLFGMNKELTALRFGRDRAIDAHHYMEDAVDFVDQLVAEHAIDCDYERTGSMLVATTPAQARRVADQLRIAEHWGLDGIEGRDEEQLADEFHTRRYRTALFDRRSALLNPARFTRGLLDLARGSGAAIHEMSPVTGVDERSTGFEIRTLEGNVHADRVVFATNAYSALFGGLAAKQTPILNHIVLTAPLTRAQLESVGWRSRCGVEDARNMLHYYRLTVDNRILIGGGDVTPVYGQQLHEHHDDNVFLHLERHLLELFPQLEGVVFTHRWSGPVSIAVDMAPIIGTLGRHKKALFAAGLTGHGVSMAPYNGLCLAELLAGRESKRTEAFFVGRRALPWPPQAIRFPIMKAVRNVMRLDDRLRWG